MANEKDEFEQKTLWIVCGSVKRRWVSESMKYGTIDLEVPGRGQYPEIVKVRSFKDGPLEAISQLVPGTVVKVLGVIGTEMVKNKAGEPVLIDGYKHYVDVLTVKQMKVDESSIARASAAADAMKKQDAPSGVDPSDDLPPGW